MIDYAEFKKDFSELMAKYPNMKMYFIGMHVSPEDSPLGIRINNGYNVYELLGIIEEIKISIIKQMDGKDSPIPIDKYFVIKDK